jgi:antitoxin VapB
MPNLRHVKLLRRNSHQLIRVPVEFELPGVEAMMRRDGDRLVIEPVRKRSLLALLKSMEPFDRDFLETEDPPPAPAKIF